MSSIERLWTTRRVHFVGVGGAGMSGYARAVHALGATVTGSDRSTSVYLERLRDEGVLDACIGHEAVNVPDGDDVEVVYSSAIPGDNPERVAARERGLVERPRAALLAELTALRRTIAVAGAHGKTTTASMIVHVLREQGFDPSWLVGSSVGAGLDNSYWAPTDSNGWLVVEADESDRSMLSLHVEIAVLTNVELDHHASFSSLAELRDAFAEFLAGAPQAVLWDRPDLRALRAGPAVFYDLPTRADEGESLASGGSSRFRWRGHEVELTVPGVHNALNATGALEAARLVGVSEQGAAASLTDFGGAARRFQRVGRTPRGAVVVDDYAHHPTEVAATLSAARTLDPQRLVAVFQPHLYSRTAMFEREFGMALAQADVIAVLEVYPARERAEDHPGVSGLGIARVVAERAHGRTVMWLPVFDAAQRVLDETLRDGDLCVVMGAGDVDVLARRLVGGESARDSRRTTPSIVRRDFSLARMATIRTGGEADYFARAGSNAQLRELLVWAKAVDISVSVVGSGSNLLIADEGVRGLVLKLDRKLALIQHEGSRMVCGGGARLPAVATRAAQSGLSGIEFAVNIPGSVGGAVRMNANAYGGRLADTLEWVEVVTVDGIDRRTTAQLGFAYRHSNLAAGEIVARASFLLVQATVDDVKTTLAQMRTRRHEAQPGGIKTFGSTFKNPDGDVRAEGRSAGLLLSEAGCNGLSVGGARFAPKHANFIENTGTATTADVLALMDAGRRRVIELFGVQLEPEVQTLGAVRFPWAS